MALEIIPNGLLSLVLASTISLNGDAEINAYDAMSKSVYVTTVNGLAVINIEDVSNIQHTNTIDFTKAPFSFSNNLTSVASHKGITAVTISAKNKQANGRVIIMDAEQNMLASIEVGALPDMVTFTPDGEYLLVANEGEPSEPDGKVDPAGSVSVINISNMNSPRVRKADFIKFDSEAEALKQQGVRLFPGKKPSIDFEPEFITVSADGKHAMVTLQEANALGYLNIKEAAFEKIVPLGYKDWMGLEIDVTGKDNGYFPRKDSPLIGMYMPDAVAGFIAGDGKQYYVMANEGDDRNDFIEGEESVRLGKWKAKFDQDIFPNEKKLRSKKWLGRLKTPKILGLNGDVDGDGDIDIIYTYGARSFSIVDAEGKQVFESQDHIERWMGLAGGLDEKRASKKGPEPEGVTVGTVNKRVYAFIGIERGAGGVMVYDVTVPSAPAFVAYVKNEGDLSPEGLTFISSDDGPSSNNLLVVTNEKSSTLTIYQVE